MIDKAVRAVDYLTHILQAIERIERYTADMSEHNFLASELTQDAVIRNFEIIGEASRNIEGNCRAGVLLSYVGPLRTPPSKLNRTQYRVSSSPLSLPCTTLQLGLAPPRSSLSMWLR
jgi:hypothetical protein